MFPPDRRDDRFPVVVDRSYSRTGSPSALENVVQHEHGHVAPDAVALSGNAGNSIDNRLPQPRLKGV
jgi:hypothetical protein